MTVQDYISQKFQGFGFHLSEADMLDISINGGIELTADLSGDNMRAVSIAIARFIPSLVMRPSSIGEGGVSFSWDRNGLKEYYVMLCKQYGLSNSLEQESVITFI